jgi:hypothetical protein
MNASLVIIISVFMAMGGLTQFVTAQSSDWTLTVNALNTINGQNILFSVYGPSGQFLTQGTAGGAHNTQQASFSISGIAVGDIYKVCVQDANFASRGMNCQQYTHSGGDEFQTIMFPDFESSVGLSPMPLGGGVGGESPSGAVAGAMIGQPPLGH